MAVVLKRRFMTMQCVAYRLQSLSNCLKYSSHVGGQNEKEEYFSVTRSTLGRSKEEKERDVEIAYPEMLVLGKQMKQLIPNLDSQFQKWILELIGNSPINRAYHKVHKIYHCRRDIKCSPIKMNMVARQIRRLPIDEAIKQLEFSPKRAAITVKEVILEAQQIAVEKYEIEDKSNMWIALSYVGRGNYIRRIRYHGKGMFGKMYEYYCHYYLMLQEGDPVLKNSKLRRSKMPELENKKRHPARILHSHTWW